MTFSLCAATSRLYERARHLGISFYMLYLQPFSMKGNTSGQLNHFGDELNFGSLKVQEWCNQEVTFST